MEYLLYSQDRDWEEVKREVVLVDVDRFGLSPLVELRENDNLVIAITSNPLPGYTMKLISLGFFDVLIKPYTEGELKEAVRRAREELNSYLEEEVIYLPKGELPKGELCEELCSIIGNPKTLKEVLVLVGKCARSEANVLITGESGVGKELFAKAIWKLSERRNKPFLAINCATIPENLLEAELFGYERGAFTGADRSKPGLFELANGGIVFLDEVGELPLSLQPKLLRVLQERRVRRLGGREEIKVDVRVICATNKDLKVMVREGKFREDLYYRINAIPIHIPPLRERKEDIPLLLNCIIKKHSKRIKGYTKAFLRKLMEYPFPGNVRELENIVLRAISLNSTGILTSKDLRGLEYFKEEESWKLNFKDFVKRSLREGKDYRQILKEVEGVLLEGAEELFGKNLSELARRLRLSRTTLYKKVKANGAKGP